MQRSAIAASRNVGIATQRPALARTHVLRSTQTLTVRIPRNWKPDSLETSEDARLVCHAVKSADAGEQLDEATMQLISDLSAGADSYVKDLVDQHMQAATKPSTTQESNELRNKVMKSILDLQSGLLERETEVRLLLLAALCGEHLLLLGPPGNP